MENIFETNKQINAKIGAETEGATTFELVKAQVAKLGGDTSKVVDIRTGEQQVLEHIKPAGPDVVIQTSKDVSISENGTTVVSPDAGYDAIKDVVVDVNVPDPELEELSVTANGTYTPTKYGYSKVDVAVPSKPEQTKSVTINQNGTTSVLPDEGSVLSKVDVTVNVAGGGGGDLFGFDAIGYDGTEQPIKDSVDYSKTIYDNWDPSITSASRLFSSDDNLVYMPKVDTSNVTNMYEMFYGCGTLNTVPLFDTSKVTNMFRMFSSCSMLTTVPQFDTSNVTNMSNMFDYCSNIKTVPSFNTSNVTDMSNMFDYCGNLKTVPSFNTSNVTDMSYMFGSCYALTTVPQFDASKVTNIDRMFYSSVVLTNFGGLLNIGQAYTSTFTYDLSSTSYLTDESIQNVIDGLYDMSAKGFSPTLTFNSDVYAKLTDAQKAQITAKNWTVSA